MSSVFSTSSLNLTTGDVEDLIRSFLGAELEKLYRTFAMWLKNLRYENVFDKARIIETVEEQLVANMATIIDDSKETMHIAKKISAFLSAVMQLEQSRKADFGSAVSVLRKVLVKLGYSRIELSRLDDKLAQNLATMGYQLNEMLRSCGESANTLRNEVSTVNEKALAYLTKELTSVHICAKITEAERIHEEALETFKKAQANASKAFEEVLKARSALISANFSAREEELTESYKQLKDELVFAAMSK